MNLSIARDGVEIGTWSEDTVKAYYTEGRLLHSDLFWKEGMPEWLPLTSLEAHTLASGPKVADSMSLDPENQSHLNSDKDQSYSSFENRAYPGLNRIEFALLFFAIFGLGFFVGMQQSGSSSNSDDGGVLLIRLIFTFALLYCLAKRLQNMGYPRWTCLFGLIPFVGFFLVLFCLFCRPGYKNPKGKSVKVTLSNDSYTSSASTPAE